MQEFKCTFCGSTVEEDESAIPKKDSRLMLAKFNEQMEKVSTSWEKVNRNSVADPWNFGVDPDLDPRIHAMDPDPAIFVTNL